MEFGTYSRTRCLTLVPKCGWVHVMTKTPSQSYARTHTHTRTHAHAHAHVTTSPLPKGRCRLRKARDLQRLAPLPPLSLSFFQFISMCLSVYLSIYVITHAHSVPLLSIHVGDSNTEIVDGVFKQCVASDPGTTQGLGGDNMTCLIVRFR